MPVPPQPASGGLDAALDLVGDRWTLRLVAELAVGDARFGALADRIGIATNVLADRLRRLERAGLVVATPYQRRPVRLEYRLTDDGRELAATVLQLRAWGDRHRGGAAPHRHVACGSDVEVREWCPTCEVVVDESSVGDEVPGADELVWL